MPTWKVDLIWRSWTTVEAETAREAIARIDSDLEEALKDVALMADARVTQVEVED